MPTPEEPGDDRVALFLLDMQREVDQAIDGLIRLMPRAREGGCERHTQQALAERIRFRAKLNKVICFLLARLCGEDPPGPAPAFTFSRDYASCLWGTAAFTFSVAQRAVVQVLHEEYEKGTPEVADCTLLDAAGGADGRRGDGKADDRRLRDIFRDSSGMNPAWGNLIVPGKRKGTHRLAKPCAESD